MLESTKSAGIGSVTYVKNDFEDIELDMGCIFSLIRAGAGLVLGVIIFLGFLLFLVLNNFSDKLLSADFYKDTIAGQDTYNRIYEEVLVDEELLDKTQEFLGDIQIVTQQDMVDLLREILPPAYIQAQVEGTIDRTIDYVNKDVDVLEAYIDLTEPLQNVKTVMFAYIDGRIDQLRVEEASASGCSINAANDLADRYVDRFNQLAKGVVPESVPSLKAIAAPCRIVIFELAFGRLVDETALDDVTKQSLKDGKGDLRLPFAAGDTLEVLKVSARLLAEPLMDQAIDKVREDLSPDLIHQIAEWNPDRSEAQIRADIEDGRDLLSRARRFGELTTLIMVIGGSILMGLVHYPNLTGMLRWPGITLLLTGVVFFVLGKIAESEVPDRLTDAVELSADKVTDVPQAVTDLGGDILVSFGMQMTDGIAGPSITLMVIGVILFGASFFTIVIKRFIPFVR